jgi:hypothetical protein
MEFIYYIFIVLFVVLPIIGAVSVLPVNQSDNNYHGQHNHIREDKDEIS